MLREDGSNFERGGALYRLVGEEENDVTKDIINMLKNNSIKN